MTRVRAKNPEGRRICSTPAGPSRNGRQFEISVIETTARGTMAAQRAAQDLARDLEAQALLLVGQVGRDLLETAATA